MDETKKDFFTLEEQLIQISNLIKDTATLTKIELRTNAVEDIECLVTIQKTIIESMLMLKHLYGQRQACSQGQCHEG